MTNPEQLLDDALAQARDEALEEAANACELHARDWSDLSLEPQAHALRVMAKKIRALKSQEQDNG